ncbi:MAG TPA: nucleotide pyrophosphohydrolase [Flavitalea sp.]|nr:nucleotide pyrophosphohydrolase [Flavitalea sp.]
MMEDISLRDAQSRVDVWVRNTRSGYFNELTNLGILMEEVGELSRIFVRTYGAQKGKQEDKSLMNLPDEMADILWVLLCLANQTGVDLTDALIKNFEKKNARDAGRHG